MQQTDLFGGYRNVNKAADETRFVGHICWDACKHCAPTMLSYKGKPYRVCSRIGSKCYPTTEVCEWSNLFDHIVVAKPVAPGWDDF